MGLKRRSVQPTQRTIGYYMKRAIESGSPEYMRELVERLKEETGLAIDLETAMQLVREEMNRREMERISKKLRGKS